jgi:hypothetical protein
MKHILAIAALLVAATSAHAQVPLPPPRPAEISLPKDWFNLGKAAEPANPVQRHTWLPPVQYDHPYAGVLITSLHHGRRAMMWPAVRSWSAAA